MSIFTYPTDPNITTAERLADIKSQLENAKSEARTLAQKAFNEEMARLFAENPELVQVNWTQYTPYFNDGDTCVFGSHHDEPGYTVLVNNTKVEVEQWESAKYWDGPEKQALINIEEKILGVLSLFDNDDMYDIFGDHVQVIVTKDGAEAQDYDHD